MIRIENVSKVYGEGEGAVKALDNISLEIPEGVFIAIIGSREAENLLCLIL